MNTLLNNPSNYIEFTIAKILGWIIQINPNISHDVSKILKNLFSNSDKSESALSLVELGKVKPVEEAFKVFKDILSDPYVDRYAKYAVAVSLINIINVRSFDKASYKQVNRLIKIIDLHRTQIFDKDLYLEIDAKTTLHTITDYITQEYEKSKNPEVIEWFIASFNELPNISETQIFLKEICKSILKSGVINELSVSLF
ncbi:hypothetical protein RPATATE_1289 [Rickettsia parkeri str. Tate's Hell]|uniref:Uncharacterized protein n=1 Tax=Rickettsia parkeri str. Tate's Hell TaxID=1359189 RepID=A0ABR5DPQ2_RICPA|nr:hypothetical protein [Rickettsia parkeri]AFC74568.1 hypothetical protein MC1_02100 [Rickettsia parkeri str. Portsmouth]KJV94773.1 hypothetical protein RPAGB_1256 [Rickettsia parkeri str. Grand Bay]KJV96582.1 hypothetical protein RPAAT24_1235 [Rickettsia parkeri str. AT\